MKKKLLAILLVVLLILSTSIAALATGVPPAPFSTAADSFSDNTENTPSGTNSEALSSSPPSNTTESGSSSAISQPEEAFVYDAQPQSAEEVQAAWDAYVNDGAALPRWEEAIDDEWVPQGAVQSEYTDAESGSVYYSLAPVVEFEYSPAPENRFVVWVDTLNYKYDPVLYPLPMWEEAIDEEWVPVGFVQEEMEDEESGAVYYTLVASAVRTRALSFAATEAAQTIDSAADLADAVEAIANGAANPSAVFQLNLSSSFAASITGTIDLSSYAVDNDIVINGASAGALAPATNGAYLFNVAHSGSGRYGFTSLTMNGGVNVGAATAEFDNCTISGTKSEGSKAAGIYVNSGTVTVIGCTFSGNATNSIQAAGNATLNVKDSAFSTNTATAINGGKTVAIENTVFEDNSVANAPGAILAASSSQVSVVSSSFVGNNSSGSSGGGAIVWAGGSAADRATFNIDKCYFKGNFTTATGQSSQGGAIRGSYLSNADIVITDSVFEENENRGVDGNGRPTSNNDGGAIAIRNSNGGDTTISVTGCNFTNNYAGDDGGAMLLEGGQAADRLEAYVANCTFVGNSCIGSRSSRFPALAISQGDGSAICFYGMTNSEITHCTFYANKTYSNGDSNTGSGAVALDTGTAADPAKRPVLSNNIFVANTSSSRTKGNVNITTNSDAGAGKNNGNVGYDNGTTGYANGENSGAKIIVANVFANVQGGAPVKEYFGAMAGADANQAQRFCYIVSPLTDEMYRDGSGPYYDANIRTDVRGYPRDHYPNAGAVEIYWTKFDPDVANGGSWVASAVPAGAIQSLNSPDIFYLVTNPSPDNKLITFPRSAIDTTQPNVGFAGWESDQPSTPGGTDFPLVQPNITITSTKQTYTAKWISGYRVDFDLQYDGLWGTPQTNIAKGSPISVPSPAPTRSGYTFGGWFKEAACTNAWNFAGDTIQGDMVLYAKWIKNTTPPVTPPETPSSSTPSSSSRPSSTAPIISTPDPVSSSSAAPAPISSISEAPVSSSQGLTGIENDGPPLIGQDGSHWALANLIAAIVSLGGGAVALIAGARRKKDNEEEETYKNEPQEEEGRKAGNRLWPGLGAVSGVASPIVFFLTENMRLPMAIFDKWTPVMVAILLAQGIFAMLQWNTKRKKDEDAEDA